MVRRNAGWMLVVAVCGLVAVPWMISHAEEPAGQAAAEKPVGKVPASTEAVKRPEPAPLAEASKKGLAYLAGQQNADGGWGQGGGWRTGESGRVEGENVKDPSDVGNTCVAVLALVRSGSLPTSGEYATHVTKGIDFICANVEKADRQSIWVTDVRDTQLQSKIGRYVDTFLAALVLSELKGTTPADKGGSRIDEALKKVIAKIESNQKEDGTFAGNGGWASVLSQGLCSKALNRAAQNGVAVKAEVLQRDFAQAAGQLEASGVVTGPPADVPATAPEDGDAVVEPSDDGPREKSECQEESAGKPVARPSRSAAGDAGIKLYNYSANGARISDLKNTHDRQRREVAAVLESKTTSEQEKGQAREKLRQFDRVAATQKQAVDEIIKQLDDERFVAGFGNNGGEEFLSHMNISETLCAQGGKDWQRWNKSISSVISKVQNGDGSWSGHHCITGRTFCTSAALLTLMADRAPIPLAAK